MRLADAVCGLFVRAGRAVSAAPAADGSGVDAACEVLDASSCSLSRGDNTIGAGALGYSHGSSGSARGAAVGVMRLTDAVGRSLVRTGRALSAAPAGPLARARGGGGGGVGGGGRLHRASRVTNTSRASLVTRAHAHIITASRASSPFSVPPAHDRHAGWHPTRSYHRTVARSATSASIGA